LGNVLARNPAGLLGALEGLAAHFHPSGRRVEAQHRRLGATHEAEVDLRIPRRGMRRNVPVPLLQTDEITRLHLDRGGSGNPEDKQ
jgi:hypothetical protein